MTVIDMRNISATLVLAACSLVFLTGQSAADGERMKRAPEKQATSPPPPTFQTAVSEIRPGGRPIVLQVHSGTLLHLSADATSMFIAGPDIADIQPGSRPDLIYIFGKKSGKTSLYATDTNGDVILNKVIEVFEPEPILVKVMRDSKKTEIWMPKLDPQSQTQTQAEQPSESYVKQDITVKYEGTPANRR
jgi:Flp pilus assembly secretin CpaC